ncbi:MAG TPA: hypothetical protein VF529_11320 [Solirubrobacteraceae bacterium]|jgi:hypothetical protein
MQNVAPRRNPWIALGGAAVLIALAVGLLTNGATTVSAQYGPPEPPGITGFKTKPAVAKAGKGFRASFTAQGPVDYRVYVIDKIDNRLILTRGKANGAETTETMGKKLKPGKYWLFVGRKSTANEKNQLGLPVYYDNLQQDFFVTK